MKVTNKIKVAAIVACLTGGYFLYTGNSGDKMNDLTLVNIEALAGGESSGYFCFGDGSVDCDGYYVKSKIDNYSLK